MTTRTRSNGALTALVIAAIVVAGCAGAGAGAGRLAAGAVLREGAAATAARAVAGARVSFTSGVRSITARRSPVVAGRTGATVTVRSEQVAAASVTRNGTTRAVAEASATRVQTLAEATATEAAGQARIQECARGGLSRGAEAYAGAVAESYVGGQPPSIVAIVADAIGSCLGAAFPNQPAAVRNLTAALVGAIGESTQQVSRDDAVTPQGYADWLTYTASLSTQPDVAPVQAGAMPEQSSTADSVDALLVVVSHAHAGRVAVNGEDWDGAIENRLAVLSELRGLEVVDRLEYAREVFVDAMEASLAADRAHAACGACPTRYDQQATSAKQEFVDEYNPFLLDRYHSSLDPTQF
jgi:hypothetical protein